MAATLGAGAAHAESGALYPDASDAGSHAVEGAIMRSGGPAALAAGIRRMLPAMVRRWARSEARPAWGAAVDEALRSSSPSVAARYDADDTPVFVDDDGLTEAGNRAIQMLRDGPYHGLASFLRIAEDLARRADDLPETQRSLVVTADLETDVLAEAWSSTLGDHDRMAATAAALGTFDTNIRAASDLQVAHMERTLVRSAHLEVDIAQALTDLAAKMSHRPWKGTVLESESGQDLPPDVLWKAPVPPLDEAEADSLLRAAEESEDALMAWMDERLPVASQYRPLVSAARAYARLCAAGGWPEIRVPWARRGRLWKNEKRIRAVQERLAIEGHYSGTPTGVYDDATVQAMMRFQAAHQLKQTGSFYKEVAVEMNVPCERRLETILLNLRRWRHTARTFEDTFVEVNIAAQEVRFVSDGDEITRTRTVVGSGKSRWDWDTRTRIYPTATPIMHNAIRSVIINPSWNVPSGIYEKEYKSLLEKTPESMAERGYVLRSTGNGRHQLVQLPGPRNAMGPVKLVFPNDHRIFLHGTNRRDLFSFGRRDFSHGCIRVQKAVKFATALLVEDRRKHNREFRERTVKRLANGRRITRVFGIDSPISVFLEYYTASVDPEGLVRFHPDVYHYDRRVFEGPVGRRL